MTGQLDSKVALITGVARGQGRYVTGVALPVDAGFTAT